MAMLMPIMAMINGNANGHYGNANGPYMAMLMAIIMANSNGHNGNNYGHSGNTKGNK